LGRDPELFGLRPESERSFICRDRLGRPVRATVRGPERHEEATTRRRIADLRPFHDFAPSLELLDRQVGVSGTPVHETARVVALHDLEGVRVRVGLTEETVGQVKGRLEPSTLDLRPALEAQERHALTVRRIHPERRLCPAFDFVPLALSCGGLGGKKVCCHTLLANLGIGFVEELMDVATEAARDDMKRS